MHKEFWFPTPVWAENFELDCSDLIFSIQSLKAKSEGREISNRGGWQSENLSEENLPEAHSLLETIKDKLDEIAKEISPMCEFKLDNWWVNVNGYGHYNIKHHHAQSALSGVFYLSAENLQGDLRFHRGDAKEHYFFNGYDNKAFFDYVDYSPCSGNLIIFPSWLDHSVATNLTEKDRISLSFNTIQKQKTDV